MARVYRSLALTALLIAASKARACEPVVPFMQVVVPAIALSGSLLVLAAAVLIKSILFAIFERRLPHLRAALWMVLGNVLTSVVGVLVAVMIGNGMFWLIGVPVVCALCWLPCRRLVKAAPRPWLARTPPLLLSVIMTCALLASCVLFIVGQGAIRSHQLALYWILKLAAILLALLASVTLTTVWEEWAIWRLSSRPEGTEFFGTVLRANLYVLILIMAVPAIIMLPKRLKSPDFLSGRNNAAIVQTAAPSHLPKSTK